MTQYAQEPDKDFEVDPGDSEPELPLTQKVAIVMVALGEEVSGEVMKHLSDYEIEEITQAIAGLKNTSIDVMDRILNEFEASLLAGEWVSQGGIDFARQALERAVGPRKAQEILDRISSQVSSGFYMLRNVPADQIAPFISHEHPQSIALILSQLEADQASGILSQLPERLQSDLAYRLATMENITPNVLKEIEESLESSLRDMLGGNQDVGGPKVVADILNLTGSSLEKNVLDNMDAQDPEVAESVHNLMFVFEDISKLSDREIQTLMREVDQKVSGCRAKGRLRRNEGQSAGQYVGASTDLYHRGDGFAGADAAKRGRRGAVADRATGAAVGGAGPGHHRPRRLRRPVRLGQHRHRHHLPDQQAQIVEDIDRPLPHDHLGHTGLHIADMVGGEAVEGIVVEFPLVILAYVDGDDPIGRQSPLPVHKKLLAGLVASVVALQ